MITLSTVYLLDCLQTEPLIRRGISKGLISLLNSLIPRIEKIQTDLVVSGLSVLKLITVTVYTLGNYCLGWENYRRTT